MSAEVQGEVDAQIAHIYTQMAEMDVLNTEVKRLQVWVDVYARALKHYSLMGMKGWGLPNVPPEDIAKDALEGEVHPILLPTN
jgi:hypothetical protein